MPLALRSVLALFGADYQSVTGAGNVTFALAHLIGVAVVVAAVALAAWRLIMPGARLVPVAVQRRRPRPGGAGGRAVPAT